MTSPVVISSQLLEGGRGNSARFATIAEIDRWDQLILANPDGGSPFRSRAFAEHQRISGVVVDHLMVGDLAMLAIRKHLPVLGDYWLVPGPGVTSAEDLVEVTEAVAQLAAEHGIVTVRADAKFVADDATRQFLSHQGLDRTITWSTDHTIIVDLSGTEEEVLARFSTRARRWIKRAAKEGVVIDRVDATVENCRIKHDLLSATSSGRFGIPDLETAIASWQCLQGAGNGQLFFARHEGRVIAAGFAVCFGAEAVYLTGGSVRKVAGQSSASGLGATGTGHALQWEMMRWAREIGCTRYDLYGAPSAAYIEDPTHPLYGVGQFKLSFSKNTVGYVGCHQRRVRRMRSVMMDVADHVAARLARSPRWSAWRGTPVLTNPDLDWFRWSTRDAARALTGR